MNTNLYFCHVVNKEKGWDFHTYFGKTTINRYRDMGCSVTVRTRPEKKGEPMTNADRIRNMTNDELAERFVSSLCMNKKECADDFDTITPKKCHACVVEWLEKKVEE